MTTLKHKTAIALVALAAAGAGLLLGQYRGGSHNAESSNTTALLNLDLTDADGRMQSLAQWRGKVLVVNFWATWCSPCMEEIPEFSRISKECAANGVQFVGIGIDTADNVRKFGSQQRVAYPLLIGQNEAIKASVSLGNKQMALPFTAVLSRSGALVYAKLGKMATPELQQAVDKALLAN